MPKFKTVPGEIRKVPPVTFVGGLAVVTKVDRRWVHYVFSDNPARRGKMLRKEWAKLETWTRRIAKAMNAIGVTK
jgi:hypothetical protein